MGGHTELSSSGSTISTISKLINPIFSLYPLTSGTQDDGLFAHAGARKDARKVCKRSMGTKELGDFGGGTVGGGIIKRSGR